MNRSYFPLWAALCIIFVSVTLVACQSGSRSKTELNVFAAASLTDAFSDVEAAFEASNPQIDVILNLAGSQQLAQQILSGAPADLYASANETQIRLVVESGLVDSDAIAPFAQNRLVVVTAPERRDELVKLEDIAASGNRLVFADPAVPIGQYTDQLLATENLFSPREKEAIYSNVVSYELNVRSILTKVALGEADAGFVYLTDAAISPDVGTIAIPDDLNIGATYWIAPVESTPQPGASTRFLEFVLSEEGQAILTQYRFESLQP